MTPHNQPPSLSADPGPAVRKRRLSLVIGAAVLVVLVLFSAFVWPHWAPRSAAPAANGTTSAGSKPSSVQPKPTIKAEPLPQDASDLLKAMPDTVGAYARTKAQAAGDWSSASPLEEYQLTYSTGDPAKDVTLTLAQWGEEGDAAKQYAALGQTMTGKELASGKVKVSGKVTGSYTEHQDADNAKRVLVLWRNATVVFRAQGPKAAVDAFYKAFPL
nr:hypothetical protein [Bifidobacterium xylocopae]